MKNFNGNNPECILALLNSTLSVSMSVITQKEILQSVYPYTEF